MQIILSMTEKSFDAVRMNCLTTYVLLDIDEKKSTYHKYSVLDTVVKKST